LSRKGSLSCHTCCDTGPRFFRGAKTEWVGKYGRNEKGKRRYGSYGIHVGERKNRIWNEIGKRRKL
jgi:hypothetical protein